MKIECQIYRDLKKIRIINNLMLHANLKKLFIKTLNKLNGKVVEAVVVVGVSNQLIQKKKARQKKVRKK